MSKHPRALIAPLLTAIIAGWPGIYTAAEQTRHSAGEEPARTQILHQLDASHELIDIEVEGQVFSMLYRPAMTPTPHGALLILPDPGVAEAWLEQVRALTNYLPEHGWSVLGIQPPSLQQERLPERTLPVLTDIAPPTTPETVTTAPAETGTPATTETTSTPASMSPTDPAAAATGPPTPSFEQQIEQRLEQARNTLAKRNPGKQLVVMGMGRAAIWSTAWTARQDENTHLLLIDPHPDPLAPDSLNELLKRMETRTIIDLYHHPLPGYPEAEPDARQRRLSAERLGLARYHQSRLPGVFRGWQAEMPWLVRHVRGILERMLLDEDAENTDTEAATPEADRRLQTPPGLQAVNGGER